MEGWRPRKGEDEDTGSFFFYGLKDMHGLGVEDFEKAHSILVREIQSRTHTRS